MNIYIDIDKVILTQDLKPTEHLKKFLELTLKNHNVFWLTTHCKGDASPTTDHLKQFLPSDVLKLCKKIKPTNWKTFKTEGIDFSKDFIWLDDYIFEKEKAMLKGQGKLNSWIQIDLAKNPNQLLDILVSEKLDTIKTNKIKNQKK